MTTAPERLRQILKGVFGSRWSERELTDFAELQDKFVFHIADVRQDVEQLSRLFRSSEALDVNEARAILQRFFIHAVPHFIAAAQIYDFVPETFPEQKGVHF